MGVAGMSAAGGLYDYAPGASRRELEAGLNAERVRRLSGSGAKAGRGGGGGNAGWLPPRWEASSHF